MKLYYLTDSTHGLLNLALQRIKVSTFEDLNDPFELMPVNVRDKLFRARIRSVKERIAKERGLLCFSQDWGSPVMWAHYADKHKGMALGFEVPKERVKNVVYTSTLLKIDNSTFTDKELRDQFARNLITTKFSDWSYEKEKRLFVDLAECEIEGGLYFKNFSDDLKLTEVVIGERSNVTVQRVKDLLRSNPYKVHVRKARSAFTKYGVTENLTYRVK